MLDETAVHFCGAVSVARYLPHSETLPSRCNTDAHRYCDLFLAHAGPGSHAEDVTGRGPEEDKLTAEATVEGIPMPRRLAWAPNHLWLDVAPDGTCHVGIDGFLASFLGRVDQVAFIVSRAVDGPIAVLSTHGLELQLAFPNRLARLATNSYLRVDPSRLTDDPYGSGWLFAGSEPPTLDRPAGACARRGLLAGSRAVAWMREEVYRLTAVVHEDLTARMGLAADGGRPVRGLVQHLGREEALTLISEFFVLRSDWYGSA
jgi:hypothetical protein